MLRVVLLRLGTARHLSTISDDMRSSLKCATRRGVGEFEVGVLIHSLTLYDHCFYSS